MPECIWCESNGYGFWECDGEGGDCPPDPNRELDCEPGQTHWKIEDTRELRYSDGEVVEGHNGPISVHVVATVPPLRVYLNGDDVGTGNDVGCGTEPPKPPKVPAARQWKINTLHIIEDVRVRVQAYAYPYDPTHHPNHHCHGLGPKVRFYALRANEPNCDDPTQ